MRFLKKVFFLFFFSIAHDSCAYSQGDVNEKKGDCIGLYWGAFDPPTAAHVAIIEASLKIFDGLIVVVNNGQYKNYTFDIIERIELIKSKTKHFDSKKITFLIQDEKNLCDYTTIKKMVDKKLCVIAGYDSYLNWMSQKNFDSTNYDCIAVIPRGDGKATLFHSHAFFMQIDGCYKHVSSSKLKELAHLQ